MQDLYGKGLLLRNKKQARHLREAYLLLHALLRTNKSLICIAYLHTHVIPCHAKHTCHTCKANRRFVRQVWHGLLAKHICAYAYMPYLLWLAKRTHQRFVSVARRSKQATIATPYKSVLYPYLLTLRVTNRRFVCMVCKICNPVGVTCIAFTCLTP